MNSNHDDGGERMRTTTALTATLLAALAAALLPASPAAAVAAFHLPPSDFVAGSTITLSGTKDVGSTLVIRRAGELVCTVADPEAVTWECANLRVPSGIHEFTGDETLADSTVVPMAPLRLRTLAAPALDGAGDSVVTTGRFTGTGVPGASILLQSTGLNGTSNHVCPPTLPTGFWSCVVDLANGSYLIRARQSSPDIGPELSGWTAAVTATIDRTPPDAPTITSPRPGTTTLATVIARGGGEPGATAQLFLNGGIVCETSVSESGTWECPVQWPTAGTFVMQALQQDAAGNFSAASTPTEVQFVPRGTLPSPQEPGPTPSATGAPSPTPGETTPAKPETSEPPSAPDPTTSNWGTPTSFGSALPTVAQIVERGGWTIAPVAGIAFMLLGAFPLRAFATHVLPRWRRRRHFVVTGRNRDRTPGGLAPLVLSPTLITAGTLGGVALIATLAGGIDTEVRYLRLTAAIGAGLLTLNLLGVFGPARLAARVGGTRAVTRLVPGILLIALIAALGSRLGGLQPPLLAGIVITMTVAATAGRRTRAGVAVAQTTGVAVLALLGWATHDILTPSTGFWMTFASETAAAIALGGVGSLLILLLPVGALPGRTLYTVSAPGWAIVALTSASISGAILAAGPAFPVAPLMLLGGAVAALMMAAVVWVRWVAPSWQPASPQTPPRERVDTIVVPRQGLEP